MNKPAIFWIVALSVCLCSWSECLAGEASVARSLEACRTELPKPGQDGGIADRFIDRGPEVKGESGASYSLAQIRFAAKKVPLEHRRDLVFLLPYVGDRDPVIRHVTVAVLVDQGILKPDEISDAAIIRSVIESTGHSTGQTTDRANAMAAIVSRVVNVLDGKHPD